MPDPLVDAIGHADRRLDASDFAAYVHHVELADLVRAHGEDPNTVAWIEYDVVDMPLLRFGIYLTNADGKRYLDCGCTAGPRLHDGECRPAMQTVEHPLAVPIPDWWTP